MEGSVISKKGQGSWRLSLRSSLRCIQLFFWSSCSLATLVFLTAPNSSRYIYSLIPLAWKQTFGIGLVLIPFFTLHELVTYITLISALYVCTAIGGIYVCCTARSLRALSRENADRIRRVYVREKSYGIYRRLQLLNAEFNRLFEDLIAPTLLSVFVGLTSLMLFVLLKFHASVIPIHFLFFIGFAVSSLFGIFITFPLASSLSRNSAAFRLFWSHQGLGIFQKTFLRSCPPIRVRISSFATFQRSSPIATFGFITYCTMRALVTFP